jgi:AAA family ATP:ADP antiporter
MAIQSASRQQRHDVVDLLIPLLGHPVLGAEAAAALAQFGDAIVDKLSDRLLEAAARADERREIPAVLIQIGTPAAQSALVAGLLESDSALRFRIISALNTMRLAQPSLSIDVHIVETALAAEIMGHYRSYQILGTLGQSLDSEGPVVAGLRQSMQQEVDRIFRLIALLIRDADIYTAYLGIESGNRTVRSNALEFLDTILQPQLRGLLLPIIDPSVSVAERVRLANSFVGAPMGTREEAVLALLHSDDPWIRSCGAYAVGTLGLRELEPELDRWEETDDLLLRQTVRTAKRALAEAKAAPAAEDDDWTSPEPMGIG